MITRKNSIPQPQNGSVLKIATKSDVWALGLVLLAVLVYFSPYLFTGKTPLPYDTLSHLSPWSVYGQTDARNSIVGDVLMQYIPWRTLYRQAILSGEMPFWNPYEFSGIPFMANYQSAVFYPFNLLFLLGSFETGALIYLCFHLLLTGVGMYLLLRSWRLPYYAALVGSLTWMMSGYLTVWMLWFAVLATLSYLPWALLSVQWLITTGHKKALGFFAIIVACIWSAGHPQHAYYCSLSIAGFAIWRLAVSKASWPNRLKGMFKVMLAAALGLIVVAPQLVASWELAQHGVRGHTSIQNLLTNSIPWRHLITLIVPEFYGNARAYWGAGNFPEYTGYVGAAGLVLAGMALFNKRLNWRSEIIFCGVYALIALHLAYGGGFNIPFSYLPGYTNFRGVQRFLGVWGLAAAGLAAFGIEAVMVAKSKRCIMIKGILTILLILAGVAFIKTQGVVFRVAQFFSCEMPLQQFDWICKTLKFPLAVLFLLSATLISLQFLNNKIANAHKQYVSLSAAVCLGILIGADLIHFSRNYLPRGQIGKGFQTTPGIERLQAEKQGRLVRFENRSIIGSPLTPNTGIMYGLEDTIGYDSLTLDRYNRLFSIIEPERYGGFAHRALGSFRHIESLSVPILDMMGGEWLILERQLSKNPKGRSNARYLEQHGWDRLYTGDDLTIYRNREAMPLAWIVGQTRVRVNDQDQLAFLRKASFNPAETSVLSEPPPIPLDTNARGEIVITHRSLNSLIMRVDIHADSGEGGLIVLRQNHYPGWQAWIDGSETALIRANYSFQAVAVPSGKHVVELKYQPTHFKSLMIVSILSLFIIGALILARTKEQTPEK